MSATATPPTLPESDPAAEETFEVATLTPTQVQSMEAAIAPFFLSLTKREFMEQTEARRMLGYVVATAEDMAADPQLRARAVWADADVPELGKAVRVPVGWFRLAAR